MICLAGWRKAAVVRLDQRSLYLEFAAAAARARGPARQWAAQFLDPSWSAEAISAGHGCGLGFGLARVIDLGNGLYEPAEEGGLPAILFPCWDYSGQFADILGPEFLDLAAWLPATGQTLRRTGLGEFLGGDALEYCPEELHIFRSPITWANASGAALCQAFTDWEASGAVGVPFSTPRSAGVVVLDWSAELLRLPLWGPRRFVVDDLDTGRRLRQVLEGPPITLPEIAVLAPAEGIAA